ncbi:MAG: AMP-binding protein [bacterium]
MPEPEETADPADLIAAHVPDPDRRARLTAALTAAEPAAARWHRISRELLTPDDPHPLHAALYAAVYAGHDPAHGPPPAWTPTERERAQTNIGRLGLDWPALHRRSVSDPGWFWPTVLDALGVTPPVPAESVITGEGEAARWLPGMKLNAAAACFAGRDPHRVALVSRREGESRLQKMTLGDLEHRASQVARALRLRGLEPGDPWAIAMPMTAESVWIYLGVVLAGGVVVSIADSFSPAEIRTRLRIAGAKGIFTQDVILRGPKRLPLYARVRAAEAPPAVVLPAGQHVADELREGDVTWAAFVDGVDHNRDGAARFTPHLPDAHEASNILFSSGTTGEPKAIPWTHITPLKAAADGWAHHDIARGHVVAWPTNLGWMMGPWLIYASLLNDAAIALFEGNPGSAEFCRFVADARVTMLGVVPSLVRTWRSTGATRGLDWSAIRCFSSTGEASNPDDMLWLMARAGYKPVVEYCGGTEIGGGYISGNRLQPQAPSTFSTPAIGCRFVLLDDDGKPAEEGEIGLVAPLFGSSETLLNRDHHEVYFEGMPPGPAGETLRRHGDRIVHLGGGGYRAQGRADDAMNLGGIKISAAEIERACAGVDGVGECAAIAHDPPGGGPSRLVLVVVPDGRPPARDALQRAISDGLNPLFKVADVWTVDALPRTASNKVMRRVLRAQYAAGHAG